MHMIEADLAEKYMQLCFTTNMAVAVEKEQTAYYCTLDRLQYTLGFQNRNILTL